MTSPALSFGADAFVDGFLLPRLKRVRSSWFQDAAAERRDFAAPYLQIGETLDVAGLTLNWLLLFEAIDWLELGIRYEVLPADARSAQQSYSDDWGPAIEFFNELRPLIGSQLRAGVEVDPINFWSSLVASERSLTSSHREFLDLMHCATESDWDRRVSELRQFADYLSRGGFDSLDPRSVDQFSWALSGSELEDHRADPAAWREAWLHPQNRDNSAYMYAPQIAPNRERASTRFGQLSDLRNTIVETVELDALNSREIRGRAYPDRRWWWPQWGGPDIP